MQIKPDAEPVESGRSAPVGGAPPEVAIAELEHGFEVEGEKARPPNGDRRFS